jgi:hypothetical protein
MDATNTHDGAKSSLWELKKVYAQDSQNLSNVQPLKTVNRKYSTIDEGKAEQVFVSAEQPLPDSSSNLENSRDSKKDQRVKFFPYAKTYPTFGKQEYKVCLFEQNTPGKPKSWSLTEIV